jgi:hypothetical protein
MAASPLAAAQSHALRVWAGRDLAWLAINWQAG